jgi:coiled-coil domain-containing protein 151
MTELEKFDHKICEIQKKLDELQAEARSKEKKLRGLVDQLSDLTREAEMVNSNKKDSAQAKEIRMIENRLDKAMIKYNETQSIKKTYELIVKRLQEERLTFDNQLTNFEKGQRSKKQDAAELDMMSRDANHAKEVAKAELARFEQQINEERKQREKDLQLRKEMVKHKLEISDKTDKKVTKMDDQSSDERGKDDIVQFDEATEKKMAEYEETMRLIKEATGVSDITDVIAKFQSQGDTLQHLSHLQKTNEERIEQLKKKKAQVIRDYEDLRFTGESKQSHSQRTLDEFKTHLEEAQTKFAETKLKYERSLKILSNAKAGIQHLNEKLESIRLVLII